MVMIGVILIVDESRLLYGQYTEYVSKYRWKLQRCDVWKQVLRYMYKYFIIMHIKVGPAYLYNPNQVFQNIWRQVV